MLPLQDIADAADQLTDPFDTEASIDYWDHNRNKKTRKQKIRQKPLLTQLAEAAFPGVGVKNGGAGVPTSRPPADLEAIACHMAISVGAAKWAWTLRVDIRDTEASTIRALVGAASTAGSDTQMELRRDLRGWLAWAQTVTGWRSQPMTILAPCPLQYEQDGQAVACGARGTIRVRLDTKTAVCLTCHGTWDEETIGLLAEHERAYQRLSEAEAEVARLRAAVGSEEAASRVKVEFPEWVTRFGRHAAPIT